MIEGYIRTVRLTATSAEAELPEAVKDVVQHLVWKAKENLGERIKFDSLKIETMIVPPGYKLEIRGMIETEPRGYTREEMSDIQVDMIRAIRGIERNG